MRATGSERRIATPADAAGRSGSAGSDRPKRTAQRRRIGLLGGTFDPVHIAHLALARAARDHLALDELRFLPTGRSWQKKPAGASAQQRIAMLRLALADLPGATIDDREIHRRGATYTIDTLLDIRAGIGARASLILIMGSDQLRNLSTWHRWTELLTLAHLAVTLRAGDVLGAVAATGRCVDSDSAAQSAAHPAAGPTAAGPTAADLRPEIRALIDRHRRDALPDAPCGSIVFFPMRSCTISGSELRQRIAAHVDVSRWLPADVVDYIERHHIYRAAAVRRPVHEALERRADQSTRKRMEIGKLQRIVVDTLDDNKAEDIRVFNSTAQTELFDRVVIATGNSNRHARALAAHVRDRARKAGVRAISVEGEETGEWVLVDLGDIVVHVMQPAIRAYYNLEEIWGAKPVRLRIGPKPPTGSGLATAAGTRATAATRATKVRGR